MLKSCIQRIYKYWNRSVFRFTHDKPAGLIICTLSLREEGELRYPMKNGASCLLGEYSADVFDLRSLFWRLFSYLINFHLHFSFLKLFLTEILVYDRSELFPKSYISPRNETYASQ